MDGNILPKRLSRFFDPFPKECLNKKIPRVTNIPKRLTPFLNFQAKDRVLESIVILEFRLIKKFFRMNCFPSLSQYIPE